MLLGMCVEICLHETCQATTSQFITIMGIVDSIKIDAPSYEPSTPCPLPIVDDDDSDTEFWARMARDEPSPVKKAHVY
jgi:hypothetical protein